jgi:hypothetical protein
MQTLSQTALARGKRLTAASILGAGLLALALVAHAGNKVPFKAVCFGQATVLPISSWWSSPGILVANVTGKATHLGDFTATLTSAPYPHLKLDITADNGDMLYCDVEKTPAGGHVTVLGGTGRFEAATGYWESAITEVGPAPGAWTEIAIGTISTIGSNKD